MVQKLEEQLSFSNDEVRKLKEKIESNKNNLSISENEIKRLKTVSQGLEYELSCIKNDIKLSEEKYRNLLIVNQELMVMRQQKDAQIEQLSVYGKESNEKINQIFNENKALLQEVKNLQKEDPLPVISDHFKKQTDHFLNLTKGLEFKLKKELENSTRQIEAYISLQNFLTNGGLDPGMHGWPISPDLGVYLVNLIYQNEYDLVIEYGSGTSTLIIAKALSNISTRKKRKIPAMLVSFEHLDVYFSKTKDLIGKSAVSEYVDLKLAPLENYKTEDGKDYLFYSLQSTLLNIQERIGLRKLKVLVLVDGPPGATGPNARYPALPIVLSYFPDSVIHFVLDDYNRHDEKEIANSWVEFLKKTDFNYKLTEIKLEKDACLLEVNV